MQNKKQKNGEYSCSKVFLQGFFFGLRHYGEIAKWPLLTI